MKREKYIFMIEKKTLQNTLKVYVKYDIIFNNAIIIA